MKTIIKLRFAIIMLFLAAGCTNNQKQTDMETQPEKEVTNTNTAISKDGTRIAYEKAGEGARVILVDGALGHRKLNGGRDLASLLAEKFTVIFYDRRGKGESTDTKPYSVDREIEDIEALVDKAGGSVYLYGASSGAALALLAAEKLGSEKVRKLALYEPPYGSDTKQEFSREKNKVNELVRNGKPGEAVTFFMGRRGMPPVKLEDMKKSPEWNDIVRIGHTLVYDFEILGDGTVPIDIARNITIPTLIMDGEKSFDFMHATADTVGKIIPGALRKTIKGQAHDLSPKLFRYCYRNFLACSNGLYTACLVELNHVEFDNRKEVGLFICNNFNSPPGCGMRSFTKRDVNP
ncbi:MAG TPA: alpha/beta hydrolase [Cyclobacteriaceae bacterium]